MRFVFSGNEALGQLYKPAAGAVARRFERLLGRRGVPIGSHSQIVAEGVTVFVRKAHGQLIALVVAEEPELRPGYAVSVDTVPDFVSGLTTSGKFTTVVDPDTGTAFPALDKFYPTPGTARLHDTYTAGASTKAVKLGVHPHDGAVFAPEEDDTQYGALRPTMFSGKMRDLVQALMGFGRSSPLADLAGPPTIGDAELNRRASIYVGAMKAVVTRADYARERRRQLTEYEHAVINSGVQIRYKPFSFATTGVTTAADGKLWLVEISKARGVLAMRLPLHHLTTPTETGWAFYEELEQLGDDDGLFMLDTFGGLPTGESFPVGTELLESAVRAGLVLRLAEPNALASFYEHTPYSTAMGWAFDSAGSEAHNTGYRFEADGVQRGVHYVVNLRIGASEDLPWENRFRSVYSGKIRSATSDKYLADILIQKIVRLTEDERREVLEIQDPDEFIRALDGLVIPPTEGSGSCVKQSEGKLYTRDKYNEQYYQIKFYEPMLGYCLSHDFRPMDGVHVGNIGECNTMMHVFFAEDQFKWVKFFRPADGSSGAPSVADDRDECMLVGSWARDIEYEAVTSAAGFYSSDADLRAEFGRHELHEVWTSQRVGPVGVGIGDDIDDFRRGSIIRAWAFNNTYERKSSTDGAKFGAVAIPFWLREGYYFADLLYGKNTERFKQYGVRHEPDAWRGRYWRCIISTAGFAYWPEDMYDCPPGCDTRINYAGSGIHPGPRIVQYVNHVETTCSSYTDNGPWVKRCDNADTMTYNIPQPPRPPTEFEHADVSADLSVTLVSAVAPYYQKTFEQHVEDASWYGSRWFAPSPDRYGVTDTIYAAGSVFGHLEASVYDSSLNGDGETRRYGPYQYEGAEPHNVTYIGLT